MLIRQVMELYDLLDDPRVSGVAVLDFFRGRTGIGGTAERVEGSKGRTDCLCFRIHGSEGRSSGGDAPTLGIIGRLGGIGARPGIAGFVSDGDGALAALAAALKLGEMHDRGDVLKGDVIVTTHICPDAPTRPHHPVPFMDSPVGMALLNSREVLPEMEAILSIDTTKGNEIINENGIALSPTVKSGYILPVSYDLLQIMKRVTGSRPRVFALSTQDITPYENGLSHLNSILQPSTATDAPVVGVAVTAEVPVAGCATGASSFFAVEQAARFAVETARDLGSGLCAFYDRDNYGRLIDIYGSQSRLQRV